MRVHAAGRRPAGRLLTGVAGLLFAAAGLSGALAWLWTQAACLASLHAPMRLPPRDAAHAMWRLLLRGGWSAPAARVPDRRRAGRGARRVGVPVVAVARSRCARCGRGGWRSAGGSARGGPGSPLGKDQRTVARRARRARLGAPAHVGAAARTCGGCGSPGPVSGRPYLGVDRPGAGADAGGRARGAADGRRAAARREVQRVRGAVAAGPRRPGAGPVHQARRLRRDRAPPARPRARVGV